MSNKKLNIKKIESKIKKIKTVGFEVPETTKQKILTSINLNKMKEENKTWLKKIFNPQRFKKPLLVSVSVATALVGSFFVPELLNKDKNNETTNENGTQKIIIRGKRVSAQNEEESSNFANLSENEGSKLALETYFGFNPDLYNIVEVPENLDLEAPDYIYKLYPNNLKEKDYKEFAYSLGFTGEDRITELCSPELEDYMESLTSSYMETGEESTNSDTFEFKPCLWSEYDISYYKENGDSLTISNYPDGPSDINYYKHSKFTIWPIPEDEIKNIYEEIDESQLSDSKNIEIIKSFIIEKDMFPKEFINDFSVVKSWDNYICPYGEETYYSEVIDMSKELVNGITYPDACAIYPKYEESYAKEITDYVAYNDDGSVLFTSDSSVEISLPVEFIYEEPVVTQNKPKLYYASYNVVFGNDVSELCGNGACYNNSILTFDVNYKGEIVSVYGSPIEKVEKISLDSMSADKILEMLLSGDIQPSYYYQYANEMKNYSEEYITEEIFSSFMPVLGVYTTDENVEELPYSSTIEQNPDLREIVRLQDVALVYELINAGDYFYVIPSYSFEGLSSYPEDPMDTSARLDETKKANCTELNAIISSPEYQEEWDKIWQEYEQEMNDYYNENGFDSFYPIEFQGSEEQVAWREQRCWVFDEYYQPAYEYPYQISVPAFPNLEIQIEA